ncbi:uncharacterized protein LOC122247976 [Penaeus japonicus]|uniref:uncharacterized protein LOC122247976 n=1 Tax=Penaeus japonicus TaxID=27405 RepID=UPI001C70DA41|nr:uncharacterized protein LOC122247976 [Penaeus japonicus]
MQKKLINVIPFQMLKEQNILLLPKDFLGLEESETLDTFQIPENTSVVRGSPELPNSPLRVYKARPSWRRQSHLLHSHLQHLNNGFPQCVGPAGGGRPRGRSSGSPRPQEAPLRIRRIRLIRRIRPRRIWLRRLWGLRRLRPWISLSVLRLLLRIDTMLKEQNILLLPKDFLGLEESETLKTTEFIYFNDPCKVIQIKSDCFTSNFDYFQYPEHASPGWGSPELPNSPLRVYKARPSWRRQSQLCIRTCNISTMVLEDVRFLISDYVYGYI